MSESFKRELRVKSIALRVLQSVGLLKTARRGKRAVYESLHARGWVGWTSLVPEQQFTISCDLAIRTLATAGYQFGCYLEFGVSRGTSMACVYHALRRAGLSDVKLIGFDSFEGMPPESAGQGWKPGRYASTIGATRRYLKKAGVDVNQVHLVKGWFRDTLSPEAATRLNIDKASLIMVDCDIYTASKEALWFSEPLIKDKAVIIFDDWGWRSDQGEIGQQDAYTEFLEAFPQFITESLPAYIPQARMFLVTRYADARL